MTSPVPGATAVRGDRRGCVKVFFDVDGVLIDGWHHNPDRRRRWDAALQEDFGIDPDVFSKALFWTPIANHRSLMHACVKGDRDLKEVLGEVLLPLGYTGRVEHFIGYWFAKDSRVNAPVIDAVRRLAAHDHIELYLATGQEHYRADHLWNGLGFKAHFRDIFYSARLGKLKTDPAFYDKINMALEIAADERPLFFDDSPPVIDCALAAGWDACLFDTADDVLGHPRLQGLL